MGELVLPSDIAVAVRTSSALDRLGTVRSFNGYSRSEAVIILTDDSGDPAQLWVPPKLKGYRKAWASAADSKLVDPLEDWGDNTDLDHLFPKSWAAAKGSVMSHVRLFPVWAEVNRSAGAGREKSALQDKIRPRLVNDIVYAEELQVLKLLGHPVGTAGNPASIFKKGSKARR